VDSIGIGPNGSAPAVLSEAAKHWYIATNTRRLYNCDLSLASPEHGTDGVRASPVSGLSPRKVSEKIGLRSDGYGGELDINDLLRKRSDLSSFVVHFTRRGKDGISPEKNLKSIIRQQTIEARTPFGPAIRSLETKSARDLSSQKCVSFSETPLEHLDCLTEIVPKRSFCLSPYGIAFTKMTARRIGVNPIWYVDITPGHDWLMNPINELIDREVKRTRKFRRSPLAQIVPFIEQIGSGMGRSGYGYRKEFWWEREWRHRGNFHFSLRDVVVGFSPAMRVGEFERFSQKVGRRIPFIDPKWSLDKMIAHLSGCRDSMSCFDE
jgi:hypothetical protein